MEELLVRILQHDYHVDIPTTKNLKKAVPQEEWTKRLNNVTVSKQDLNNLIMNFLVIEGYKEAAEKFQLESGTAPTVDLQTISDRMIIRNAIQSGNVDEAIKIVSKTNPTVLESNPNLYFHLQQQRLIELIRNNNIQEALDFAQKELAPNSEFNPQFMEDLEKTMALLAFEDQSKCPLGNLLDGSQRQKTASELNSAILLNLHQEKDPKLPKILQTLKWAQNQLESKGVKFPKINNVVTGEFDSPTVTVRDSNNNAMEQ
mmetsp:Transcript_22464/g.31303  ORF Transcript_22464/g.31303 Transcript_22464/m.31303 type:complete len:259 (-) Transcript_22464:14-790(-)